MKRLNFAHAFMDFLNKGAYFLNGTCNHESQQVCYDSYFPTQSQKCTTTQMDPDKKIYKATCAGSLNLNQKIFAVIRVTTSNLTLKISHQNGSNPYNFKHRAKNILSTAYAVDL